LPLLRTLHHVPGLNVTDLRAEVTNTLCMSHSKTRAIAMAQNLALLYIISERGFYN